MADNYAEGWPLRRPVETGPVSVILSSAPLTVLDRDRAETVQPPRANIEGRESRQRHRLCPLVNY